MKNLALKILFLLPVLLWCCQQKGNQELYEEVMKIHDEVMPKMNDIHKLKMDLKTEIDSTTEITQARKTEIETAIVKLDSASEGMMVWMREFNPIPDSEGEDKAREYLENEKVKVTKVKENMLQALEKAKKVKSAE